MRKRLSRKRRNISERDSGGDKAMRMRRKCNLEARLEACGEMLLYPCIEERNSKITNEIKEYIDLEKLFGNDHPLELEIGCGMGGFACELAKRNPDKNILAVEKSENVIVEGCERAVAEGIANLRFLTVGAEYLPKFLKEGSVSRIYLNFSCPYPKKTYANHRLTNRRFLAIYEKLLMEGAEIHQKTDNMPFFEYSIEELTAYVFALKNISLDLHKSSFDAENIRTEYEKKFAAMGKPIYRLEAYLR